MAKGICPVCNEAVELVRLTFAGESELTQTSEEKKASNLLCGEHPAKEGCRSTSIVGTTTGVVHKTICDGSLRPRKAFVH
ncbi:MAG TPA: hypothetical protein VJJ02_01100 [Candidatus Paceibacterota bacterium]